MAHLTIGLRFLLEVLTVLGLLASVFTKHSKLEKAAFFILGILLILIWSKYGAPKSPEALTGIKRLLLEISVFSVGAVSFMRLYGLKIGLIYLGLSFINLAILHLCHFQ